MKPLLVSEIFGPTIQGEGAQLGRPTVFVRLGACDYRCSWCDTLYAVLPEYKHEWQPMTPDAILAGVAGFTQGQPILITLSGGNPALQSLGDLLDAGHARGHTFTMETQGSIARAWFSKLDYLTISPKPPSAGNVTPLDAVARCLVAFGRIADASLKVVVFNDADFDYARAVHTRFPDVRLFLQVGTPRTHDSETTEVVLRGYTSLIERVLDAQWYDVTVLPQVHVLLWGNKRGV